MHENKYNSYKVPSGLLILFLEKALTLVHMETHLDDVSNFFLQNEVYNLLFWPYSDSHLTAFSYLERWVENMQGAIFSYWAP